MTYPVFSAGEVLGAADMNAVGLWLVTGKDLSGTATSVDNCFTSNYRNYRIVYRIATSSADPEIRFTLRVGGVDAITNYNTGSWLVDGAGTLNYSQSGAYSRWNVVYAPASNTGSGVVDIIGPAIAANTSWTGNHTNSTGGGNARTINMAGNHLTATAYDGFTLTASTGTFTGRVQVYGYRN